MDAHAKTHPAFDPHVPFATLDHLRKPRGIRWIARMLVIVFAVSPVALLLIPWQQTVRGRGQIIAYAPIERKQVVTAMVGGQVKTWHVVEGSRVKVGDPIADIEDNDPDLAENLIVQRRILSSRWSASKQELGQQTVAVAAQEKALEAAVGAAKANRAAAVLLVDVALQARKNNEFALRYERRRYEMFDQLFKNPKFGGLEPELSRDEAQARADRAVTDVARAAAEIKRADASVLTNDSLILQAQASGLSSVATATRDLRRVEQSLFGIEREQQELDVRIERFKARFVKSPTDGVVFRVSANAGSGGQYVKEGDELAVIVPDVTDRVVELRIGGVDAPLIAAHMEKTGEGPHVRLQFEGWPAVQFAGWPSVATGTFGGKVRQIDPTDDGFGRFRILVEPEQLFDEDVWPEPKFLRQGNQAVGWVFLNRVTLGYELWRQFNGFPPVIAPKPPEPKDGGKPPKVKL